MLNNYAEVAWKRGAVLGSITSQITTIVDDETLTNPTISFGSTDALLFERQSITVALQLSEATNRETSVN